MTMKVAIVGAAGYAGIELVRLVLGHPELELVIATSRGEAGASLGRVYPALAGATDIVLESPDVERMAHQAEVAFLAVPHTTAMDVAPALLDAGLVVIDASADFRLRDPAVYEHWYGTKHTAPALLEQAIYGLPELDRSELLGAALVACPGCYPTATLLASVPAFEAGVVAAGPVVVDAKSGVSGAGRSAGPGTHFPSVNESVQPYAVGAHRHTPEIEQGIARAAGRDVEVVFAPHLVPMTRGLLSTVYLPLESTMSAEDAVSLYRDRYSGEPFITVHDAGVMPSTAEVRGGNRAHIGIASGGAGSLVVACAIDNLVKGTSGQAIQCANLVLGYAETAGLDAPGPVV